MAFACGEVHVADQLLVADARTGSAQAFEVLVSRYHPQILRYLVRQVGDREMAADLAQETFLDAFRQLHRLKDDQSFVAWLYRIARYNMLHEQRRRRIRQFISLDWCFRQFGDAHQHLREPDSTAPAADRDMIQQVLDELNPSLREALLLSSLNGFPGEEVAQILDISPAAARQRISRAKAQFRERYHALNGGSDETIL